MTLRITAMALLGGAAALAAASVANAAEICTAIADATTGKVLMQRGDCQRQVTPASTFKIPLSLMGYDAGFLKDVQAPELPFRTGLCGLASQLAQRDRAGQVDERVGGVVFAADHAIAGQGALRRLHQTL